MSKSNTRKEILIAAKEVFSKKGYTGATTKEISKSADVAEITLFRHFDTKINLFYEVISEYLILPMLDLKILDNNMNDKQSIIILIQERIDTLRNNKELFLCIICEAQFNDEVKNMLQIIHSKTFEVLKLYLKSNREEVNNEKIEHITQMFLSTIIGVIIFETIGGNRSSVDSEDLIKTIRTLVFE